MSLAAAQSNKPDEPANIPQWLVGLVHFTRRRGVSNSEAAAAWLMAEEIGY
jgi:hypothetical protein